MISRSTDSTMNNSDTTIGSDRVYESVVRNVLTDDQEKYSTSGVIQNLNDYYVGRILVTYSND